VGDGPNKTVPTGGDVAAFLAAVPDARRRADAATVLELMQRVTGLEPVLWGSAIVGFGSYHYRYPTGREGDMPAAGFSPRKAATTIYLMDGLDAHAVDLALLGPHRVGQGCLYLARLDRIDVEVLERIVRRSFEAVAAGPAYHQDGTGSGHR
jgi:hypothetical protein